MSNQSNNNIEKINRVLEVNLNAIKHNFAYYRSLINPKTKILVVVKADAYGLGSVKVSKFLQKLQVDYLGVASIEEGVELREAGITIPIIVLNPAHKSLNALIEFNLEPTIYSFGILNSWLEKIESNSDIPKMHLKLDTGMHRLGFVRDNIDKLTAQINYNKLQISSIFTHLAGADESLHDNYTEQQLVEFENCCKKIKEETNQEFIIHALNSSGIISHPEGQFNMVRLGIGLYGFDPVNSDDNLKTVASLYSVISQIKNIKKGETIGYSRAGIANDNMQIATINIGYADGVSRQLSNGIGSIFVNNQKTKIVGNICMDMLMIDVTKISCNEGDKVEVFGNNISIVDVAKQIDTIPYEVLTSVSQRVKRVYL